VLGFAIAVRAPCDRWSMLAALLASPFVAMSRGSRCPSSVSAGEGVLISNLPCGGARRLSCSSAVSTKEEQRDRKHRVCWHSLLCVSRRFRELASAGDRRMHMSKRGLGTLESGPLRSRHRRRSIPGCLVWSRVAVDGSAKL
jgi:hypothetical protein